MPEQILTQPQPQLKKKRHQMREVLADLPKHPKLLQKCKELYLNKIIYQKPDRILAEEWGLHLDTVNRYINAYRAIASQYHTFKQPDDIISALEHEISELRQKKITVESRYYPSHMKEIRNYLSMIAELRGWLDKRPQIQVNIVQNIVSLVVDTIPAVLESLINEGVTPELRGKILDSIVAKLSHAVEPTEVVEVATLPPATEAITT